MKKKLALQNELLRIRRVHLEILNVPPNELQCWKLWARFLKQYPFKEVRNESNRNGRDKPSSLTPWIVVDVPNCGDIPTGHSMKIGVL